MNAGEMDDNDDWGDGVGLILEETFCSWRSKMINIISDHSFLHRIPTKIFVEDSSGVVWGLAAALAANGYSPS